MKIPKIHGEDKCAHYNNTWGSIRVMLSSQTHTEQKKIRTMVLHLLVVDICVITTATKTNGCCFFLPQNLKSERLSWQRAGQRIRLAISSESVDGPLPAPPQNSCKLPFGTQDSIFAGVSVRFGWGFSIEVLYKQRPDRPAPSCISQCKLLSGDEAPGRSRIQVHCGGIGLRYLPTFASYVTTFSAEQAHQGYRLAVALANCNTSNGHCVRGCFKPSALSWGLDSSPF